MKVYDTYPGGKGGDGTYQTIINSIPPHNVYIDGFLGNSAIMRYKRLAPVNVGVDVDKSVIDQWGAAVGANNIDLFNMPFLEYWREFGHHFNFPDTFVLLDPPYPMGTKARAYYDNEMTDVEHEKLLSAALAMKANVMICCYENELYDHFLAKWYKQFYQNKTRAGSVTEVLYTNYEIEDGKLHDYRFVGSNFTERQRIKRKIDRHVERLKRLPEEERNAIIQEISSQFQKVF
jgi:DNA adenine methylase